MNKPKVNYILFNCFLTSRIFYPIIEQLFNIFPGIKETKFPILLFSSLNIIIKLNWSLQNIHVSDRMLIFLNYLLLALTTFSIRVFVGHLEKNHLNIIFLQNITSIGGRISLLNLMNSVSSPSQFTEIIQITIRNYKSPIVILNQYWI